MEWYTVAIGLTVLLVAFIAIGLPIPFAMVLASLPFLWGVQSFSTSLVSTELMIWGAWVNYIFLSIPLFVLLGELVGNSQIGARLYRVMHHSVRATGAAAYGSIGACAGFGAICGSSMIGALTIGAVAVPQMLKLGYDKRLTTGLVAAGGTLSVMIPPSLVFIYYGIITNTSIGKLFIAGILPGLVLVAMFVVTVLIWSILRPQDFPHDRGGVVTLKELVLALLPIALIGGVITGAIYFGITTPTEAAAVATLFTLVLAFAIGNMTLAGFLNALTSTMRTMGFLGILLSAALLFGFVLNYYRVPQAFTQAFLSLDLPPSAIMLMVIVFYLIAGMFLETATMTFITLPIVFPLIQKSGYDPIWFGIVYTVTMEIAVLTPPVGLNLYVLQGIAPKEYDVKVADVIIGSMPFVGALLALIGLLIAVPDLALWLPRAMK